MTKHGIEVFDATLQKTYDWINDLMRILNSTDKQHAYLTLRATLHALRDRLPFEITVKLGAQLPMLIRGLYYEGWKPSNIPIKLKNSQDFIDFVAAHFANSNLFHKIDLELVVRAVFQVMSHHISPGEIDHLKQVLPPSISALFNPGVSARRD